MLPDDAASESARSDDYVPSTQLASSARRKDRSYIRPKEAIFTREFWILWCTRFCVVLCTQVRNLHPRRLLIRLCSCLYFRVSLQTIAGFYKAFGQTFISDDHFLSFVGAVCSVFNCSGRLVYGLLMDKYVVLN